MKKDIDSFDDVKLLVDSFYDQVKPDAIIGYIFNDIAQVDWEKHLPRMYSFWASMLLGESTFNGDPMSKHIQLHKQTPLTQTHFDRWLHLWTSTLDQHFEGKKADEAKARGKSIADLMLFKISKS
jgi:hemoglobin